MTRDERSDLFSSRRAAALLLVLAALPFLPSLFDPFFSDDYLHIERLAMVRPGQLVAALRSWVLRAEDMGAWWTPGDLAVPYFRPLVTLSFLLDHALWGMRPLGYHLTNLLLHLATTLLCLRIARHILVAPLPAWGAALIFGLHPCHTEAVAWISGRTDVVAGCFGAAALLCHLEARAGKRRLLFRVACLLCFLLSLAAKEMALTLPAILLLYDFFFPPKEPGLGPRLTMPAALAGTALVYLVLRGLLLGGYHTPPHPFAHAPGDPDMLPRVLSALPIYLGDLLLFVPADPVVTYPFWMRHPVLFGLFCALSLSTLRSSLYHSRAGQARAARFGLCFTLVSLLPVLPVTVGERFLYLPSLGYVLLIGAKLPELGAALSSRVALGNAGVALLTLVVSMGKSANFSWLAKRSRQSIDEALQIVDETPRARRVLAFDLPQASALAFTHALRLSRPERGLDAEIVSVAPYFLSASSEFQSTITRNGDEVVVRATGTPYLGTYVEQAYLGQRAPLSAGELIERPGYTVRVLETEGRSLRAFSVKLQPGSAPDFLLLRGDGFHLRPL
jgi:hypothetical protein